VLVGVGVTLGVGEGVGVGVTGIQAGPYSTIVNCPVPDIVLFLMQPLSTVPIVLRPRLVPTPNGTLLQFK
jgi:hypothetical protein